VSEPPAFEALIKPHLHGLYRLAYRLTGSVADAEDLLQEVLIRLYRRGGLHEIESLQVWLKRVLYNQFIDEARRYARRRLEPIEESGPELDNGQAPEDGPETQAARAFDRSALQKALAALPVDQRTVVLMHDSEGYKLVEIQEITGIELGTLKSRLHRGRERLRRLLTAMEPFDPRHRA
jgi:RNA polymerase sigma-70 factor (ECF subfamily)